MMDVSQFRAAFFEESMDSLDAMEAALLELDPGVPDAEAINTIFRGAHSIKGGAGMFGFTDITAFTHVLETLLDLLRSSRIAVTPDMADCMLRSVDVLRSMLGTVRSGVPADAAAVQSVLARLTAFVDEGSAQPASPPVHPDPSGPARAVAAGEPVRWHLRFESRPTLLVRGNDPLRMFSELAVLGDLAVVVDASALPPLVQADAEVCVLAWDLYLTTAAPVEAIELIFEWAEGDCVLKIERQADPAGGAEGAALPGPAPAPPAGMLAQAALPARACESARSPGGADSGSIRVSIEKIDGLLNTVGEIVIAQSMLSQLAERIDGQEGEALASGLAQLGTYIRALQEDVMRVRMLPVSFVFSRFPRLVRDLSQRLGKRIQLVVTGDQTELDKTILEKIGDPLVHLVRNCIDHGIESPAERAAAGKPEEGVIHLNAYHKGGAIVLEVGDDGRGLARDRLLAKARSRGLVDEEASLTDAQVHELIFLPGFSTAEQTTDLSGRGVGMDVVRRNIKELGGSIELASQPGRGTRFTIKLPLTLAIVDGQLVSVGGEIYVVPLVAIVESLQLRPGQSNSVAGECDVLRFRGEYLPILRLHEVFGVEPGSVDLHDGLIMVVEGEGRRVGLFVDALLAQQQVVIKSMETHYGAIEGVGGATILGDGAVSLILDIPALIRMAATRPSTRRAA